MSLCKIWVISITRDPLHVLFSESHFADPLLMLTSYRLACCTNLCVHAEIRSIRSALVEWSCTSSRWCKCIFDSVLGCEEVPMQQLHWAHFVALIWGLPTVQFWLLAVCKNGGGRPGIFYHMNDVSVYRARGLILWFLSQALEFRTFKKQKSTAPDSNEECMCEMCFFDRRTLPFLSSNCS